MLSSESDIPLPALKAVSFLMCAFLFLPSCSKRPKTVSPTTQLSVQLSEADLLRQAKQVDISIPIGFVPRAGQSSQSAEQPESESLCYTGQLPLQTVVKFYKENMERSGWDITNLSSQGEGLFVCNKTDKSCVLSIRPDKDDHTNIYLFLKNKLEEAEQPNVDINAKEIIV